MDLEQNKLSKSEWETIEKPVSQEEKQILELIINGYSDTNIRINATKTFLSFSKIEKSEELEYFAYKKYFSDSIQKYVNKYGLDTPLSKMNDLNIMGGSSLKQLKSSDSIRIQNVEVSIRDNKQHIFEFILIDLFGHLLKNFYKKKSKYIYYYYTLLQFDHFNITNINTFVLTYIKKLLQYIDNTISKKDILYKSYDIIEKNDYIIKYSDLSLYPHQKEIFEMFNSIRNDITHNCEITKNIHETILNSLMENTGASIADCEKALIESGGKQEDAEEWLHEKELTNLNKSNGSINTNNEVDKLKNSLISIRPQLILYTAPTGTGKTLTPIGLSESFRVIFVCVARHIGMALAKSAISVDKKIAFAFGCQTASDIRLHYYSAVEYTKNKRSGGIGKVDNSVGTNVDIIICDVQSYLTSMYYMLAFNDEQNIITYWDEPTITLDYEHHELHDTIHRNWKENKISKMILSCATLPTQSELKPVFDDFTTKFNNAELKTITSYDCKKSIPLLDKSGFSILPHYVYKNYDEMIESVKYIYKNKTLLRYFDLNEIIEFIKIVNKDNEIEEEIDIYFQNKTDINMNSIKAFYLELLLSIDDEDYETIYKYFQENRKSKFENNEICRTSSLMNEAPKNTEFKRTQSIFSKHIRKVSINTGGLLATTSDAYTFTDGPTIYLTDDIDKIGTFYIQKTNIEESVFKNLMNKIFSNQIQLDKIADLEKKLDSLDVTNNNDEPSKKSSKVTFSEKSDHGKMSNEGKDMMKEINQLRKKIYTVTLDPIYIPNTIPHQNIWSPQDETIENAFVSDIGEQNTKKIMGLNVNNNYKVLMLLGIGTFKYHENKEYMEIMKDLANQQKLFMIIASTDYIYGTNYQFCHGFIGKDLENTTQQKILQVMGRIGRNNIQQDYTIRIRSNEMIDKILKKQEENLESTNMCRLFNSD